MGLSLEIPRVIPNDWKRLDLIVNKIKFRLGRDSSPTHAGLTLSGLTEGRVLFAGTSGVVDDDGELLWNNTSKRLTTTGLTVTNAAVIGSDSVVFQPNANSTTFLQVLDAAGASILNLDSTNRQVTIGQTSSAYPFLIKSTDGSDQIGIYHDNINAHITSLDDGDIRFESQTGYYTFNYAAGKTSGYARFFNVDRSKSLQFGFLGSPRIDSLGAPIMLNYGATQDVVLFQGSSEGRTRELLIFGFRTGDSVRQLQIGVGKDAADTVSFDGLSNYWFDGTIKSTAGAQLGDGGITNYTEIESDGTIVFKGNATTFNDIVISLSSAKVPPANAPSWDSFIGNLNAYAYAVNDFQEFSTELSHSYKNGVTIEFHIHGAVNGADGDDRTIKFEIEYTIADVQPESGFGDVYPSTTTINAELTIPASTTDLTAFTIDIGDDTTGNFVQGAIVKGRIRRIASSGSEPSADPFLTEVGIHIESDTIGTRTATSK